MTFLQFVDTVSRILVDATAKGTVLLGLFWLATLLLHRSSAALRHRMWGLAMIGLMILPTLSLILPTWQLPVLSTSLALGNPRSIATGSESITQEDLNSSDVALQSKDAFPSNPIVQDAKSTDRSTWELLASRTEGLDSRIPWMNLLAVGVWMCGVVVCVSGIATGFWHVRQLSLNSNLVKDEPYCGLIDNLRERLGLKRWIELRECSQSIVPLTCGLLHPIVIVPKQSLEWAEQLRRAVLMHELAHVKRHDVACQLLGRLACSLYWFHPLAWFGLHRMRQEREQACDDEVVFSGELASSYAEQLLEVARLGHSVNGLSLAVEMARPGSLEQRLQALFDSARSHVALSRRWAAISLALMLLLAIALAVVKPVPAKTSTDRPVGSIGLEGLESGPLEHTVKVVDSKGQSVVGAKLVQLGFGTSKGVGMGWLKDWPKDFVTNNDGLVVIAVPDVSAVMDKGAGGLVLLDFAIEHPSHPTKRVYRRSLEDRSSVILGDSLKLAFHVFRAGEQKLVTTDIFLETSGFGRNPPKLVNDAWVLDALSPIGFLRVIHAPDDQLPWFSELIDLKREFPAGGNGQLEITLHQGVRVEGKLAQNVPRPVKLSTVCAYIYEGERDLETDESEGRLWQWNDTTQVTADGDFFFKSLPRDTNLELIAICDGWVSQSPTEVEQNEYSRQYGISVNARPPTDGRVYSRFFRLEREIVYPVLFMEQTESCEVTVVDSLDRPVMDVNISFYPNQLMNGSMSTYLGMGWSSLQNLQHPADAEATIVKMLKDSVARFEGKTDSNGRTVIKGLPIGSQNFSVKVDGYELAPDPKAPPDDWRPLTTHAIIQPGERTRTKVKLRSKS